MVAAFNGRLQENSLVFGVNRTKILSCIDSYANMASTHAREVLQAIFFAPRGAAAPTIKKDIAPRIDAIHEMFKLDVGKALIDKDHPVGMEYELPIGGGQIRFFSLTGTQGETVVKTATGSASLQLLEALGKSKILSVALPGSGH